MDYIDESSLITSGIDAEALAVGVVLMYPETIHQAHDLSPEDFQSKQYGTLWGVVREMFAEGQDFGDRLLLMDRLRKSDRLDAIGGPVTLSDVCVAVANSAGMAEYVSIIKREGVRNRARSAAESFLLALPYSEPSEAIQGLQSDLNGHIADSGLSVGMKMLDVAKMALDETLNQENGGFETGYFELDKLMGGEVGQSHFTVLAAGPSFGKSALAVNLAIKGRKQGQPLRCLYICMEMDEIELFDRMVSAVGEIPTQVTRLLRINKATEQQRGNYEAAYGDAVRKVAKMEHIIQATGLVDINSVRALVAMHRDKIDCVIIDYLQQLKPSKPSQSTFEKVNEASWSCKDMAMKYKIPVIALSQLNRDGYKDGKKPGLENLRESGQLEQDANNVWMLWRKKQEGVPREELELFVAKNRGGGIARIELDFMLKYGQINNLTPKTY